ncbi:MAG: NifB/NifX family molybdenum-iron cluster-binding protein [Thiobacillaceae bacterium]
MKIAVTSQNRRTVTDHAGRCRRFWIYEISDTSVKGRTLLELPIEQTLHESAGDGPHPLDEVQVLITGGMGPGMRERMHRRGIIAVTTTEKDPDQAVAAWLQGNLNETTPQPHALCQGQHHHRQA